MHEIIKCTMLCHAMCLSSLAGHDLMDLRYGGNFVIGLACFCRSTSAETGGLKFFCLTTERSATLDKTIQ